MEEPEVTPEDCIERAIDSVSNAETAMDDQAWDKARLAYMAAFDSIHVFHHGRRREIKCEHFYNVELRTGRFTGQYAHYVRIMLRIQLVASVMECYLKLKDYEEALFWGRRSILTFKRSTTYPRSELLENDPVPQERTQRMADRHWLIDKDWDAFMKAACEVSFAGKPDMGLIFYRTAVAGRAVRKRDDEEVQALIKAAMAFRPEDELVRTEFRAMNMRELVRRDDLVYCANQGPG